MSRNLNNLHHASLVIGSVEKAQELLHNLFGSLNNSPDFFVFKPETFGIEEARQLSLGATRKAFGERKIFLITPAKITLEAQHALLKTFEDPAPNTHFFLVVKNEELVIPTLRSRMQTVQAHHRALNMDAEKFLKLLPKDRLLFVRKFVDGEKNLSDFLDELLVALRKSGPKNLETVYNLRRFSDDRSVSVRLILEHLALVL